ncbi:uncharacterized protein LOC127794965 isoform X2 [Diospyros lotus]|uniref:uncharacterized protein LOC127794965 isoform X2 n=1 Tax=Diospyros lotus TaxID=55363 RepID=UPI0022556FAE|nr:uncharacterized protein LOC127794965 isoform X2 [Diospyros lotus]
MASLPHSSWFCTLRPTNSGVASSTKPTHRNYGFKSPKASSSSSNAQSSPQNSSEAEAGETDPVKLAFARAKAYKKSLQSNPAPEIVQNPVPEPAESGNPSGSLVEVTNNVGDEEVPLSVRLAMDKAKEYRKSKEITTGKGGRAEESEAASGIKNDGSVPGIISGGNQEVPSYVKVAMERAKEYEKNKGASDGGKSVQESQLRKGLKGGNGTNSGNALFEKMTGKKEELKISSLDFVGLDFAEKKSRRLPAGLIPVSDPFQEGDMPEVEILVGDTSKFENAAESQQKPIEEDNLDVYKPKVSTWGVFPRPSNISKTYGGGRVIRPGEQLETAEDKAAKEKRTRELLAAYRSRTGLSIDTKLKFQCEKALQDGDSLMDCGKLNEALPFYEQVMDKLTFQSELHGLAALQWSICQDSLSRPNEARGMYERLQSHPNVKVSKRAKQFLFGFQAMEMMKVKRTSISTMNTGYQNYFEAFLEDKANYSLENADVEEGVTTQVLPYILFLVSPVIVVLLIAGVRG